MAEIQIAWLELMTVGGLGAVLVATLSQEVDDMTAAFGNPIHTLVVIHESQYLNGIQFTYSLSITANSSDSILFTF